MKIIGTGVDIVENSRIKKSIATNSFLNRVFTNKEILISKKIKNLIKKRFKINSFNFFLSISDEKKYSIAFVIFQK